MKKTVLIVQVKDADAAVQKLRALEVVHVEHQQAPKGKDINLIHEDLAMVNSAIDILSEKEFLNEPSPAKPKELSDWEFTSRHIIDLRKRLEQLDDYSRNLINRIAQWEPWGDFSPQDIEALAQKDIHLRFYQVPVKEIENLPAQAIVKKVSVSAGIANCVIISQGKINIPLKELIPPKISLAKMRSRLNEDRQVMDVIREQIRSHISYIQDFLNIKKRLTGELQLHEALRGMGQAGELLYLAGYIPFDQAEPLMLAAKEEKWGLVINDPSEEDTVPTLMRNPKWVTLINPVFKLLEVVPGYRELDISPLFLLFLALFFGMIIGDAGYGAVYFGLTFLAQRKYSHKVKDKTPFFLFYLFSSCAIMWGLLTGTVFGQQWYLASGFKALLPALNDAKFAMAFCFLLGALQLSLGHGWQALKKLPSLAALSDIGFICLLWVGFLLAKLFILGDPFPVIGQWLAWLGIILIIFFVSPQKNLLKGIGAGLGTLALGLMGNFGDVVSYIRLFAVGLAGVAVADSVNMLAAGVGANFIAQALILFVGHSINIILGPMSVLVHGIRLNVLEFSLLHGNVTWSGLAYKPLKE